MRFSLVLAALLCFTTWMGVVHATHAPVSSCCLGWSNTRVLPKRIVGYTFQTEGVCSITAVVFQSKRGVKICSDPNSDWARKVILKVDEEKKRKMALQVKAQNEEGLTSDVTPTVSLPLTTKPQKKCRNGRRRQKKKSRGGRRGQKKCV
ncbi:C-C motif chemokine 4-like [Cyclopterus lumpus]|uniref:Chemokine interleukin-8-like domain-containing protein n=1 Tax=Cyclopterus lumpus TaxID=8103 RepID=A0A8C2XEE5_CYCLU|nr:C-C motif chemokine 4-like [Cyclopterus lumpus]